MKSFIELNSLDCCKPHIQRITNCRKVNTQSAFRAFNLHCVYCSTRIDRAIVVAVCRGEVAGSRLRMMFDYNTPIVCCLYTPHNYSRPTNNNGGEKNYRNMRLATKNACKLIQMKEKCCTNACVTCVNNTRVSSTMTLSCTLRYRYFYIRHFMLLEWNGMTMTFGINSIYKSACWQSYMPISLNLIENWAVEGRSILVFAWITSWILYTKQMMGECVCIEVKLTWLKYACV